MTREEIDAKIKELEKTYSDYTLQLNRLDKTDERYDEIKKIRLNTYSKMYYYQNYDTIMARQVKYREDNKEIITEKRKAYIERSKDRITQYLEDNKERLIEYRKEYYKKNREVILQRNKDYYKKKKNK